MPKEIAVASGQLTIDVSDISRKPVDSKYPPVIQFHEPDRFGSGISGGLLDKETGSVSGPYCHLRSISALFIETLADVLGISEYEVKQIIGSAFVPRQPSATTESHPEHRHRLPA